MQRGFEVRTPGGGGKVEFEEKAEKGRTPLSGQAPLSLLY
jgi:hypothetical protein